MHHCETFFEAQTLLYLLRCYLSGLINGIGSFLATVLNSVFFVSFNVYQYKTIRCATKSKSWCIYHCLFSSRKNISMLSHILQLLIMVIIMVYISKLWVYNCSSIVSRAIILMQWGCIIFK